MKLSELFFDAPNNSDINMKGISNLINCVSIRYTSDKTAAFEGRDFIKYVKNGNETIVFDIFERLSKLT